jgi:co-chaperonin GroES (HSP10)
VNAAKIRPIGDQILILPDQVEQTTSSGIQIMSDKEMDRLELGQTEGVVVAIAKGLTEHEFFSASEVKVSLEFALGDRVIFAKFAGLLMDGADGKRYRLIERKDIKGVFENDN